MRSFELAQHVVDHGVQLFRPTKDKPGEYDHKDFFTGSKRGWLALDAFSASAILAVYKVMKPEIQTKFEVWPPQKQAAFAFKYVK